MKLYLLLWEDGGLNEVENVEGYVTTEIEALAWVRANETRPSTQGGTRVYPSFWEIEPHTGEPG